MPATNYGWSLQDSTTIFQALGTKRKNKDTEVPKSKRQCTNFINDNVYNEMKVAATNVQCNAYLDRKLLVPMETTSETNLTENRVPESHSQFSGQVSVARQECKSSDDIPSYDSVISQGAYSSVVEENNNNVPSQNCPQQNSMIMDIPDECYTKVMLPCNVTTDAEYEAACYMVAAMESEGAPDPSQYRYNVSSSSQRNSYSTRSDASLSPGDSMDMRPYVSDYY